MIGWMTRAKSALRARFPVDQRTMCPQKPTAKIFSQKPIDITLRLDYNDIVIKHLFVYSRCNSSGSDAMNSKITRVPTRFGDRPGHRRVRWFGDENGS